MQSIFQYLPLGARYMILSTLGFSIMGTMVKLVSAEGIPVLEIVAARSLISFLLSAIEIKRKGIAWLGQRKILLLARGLVGALALVCVYYALVHLPFAVATVLQYLYPMFTAILAIILLREKVRQATLFCIVISFLGLLTIIRPGFLFGELSESYSSLAIVAAIIGALGSSVAYILVRKLNETEDPAVIILYFPMIAFPISLVLLGDAFVMPQGWTWLMLLAVGVATQVGQVGLTKAMQTETASKAASFSYLQVVFAALIGWFVFSEYPSLWVWLGGGMIILGAFVNLVWKK